MRAITFILLLYSEFTTAQSPTFFKKYGGTSTDEAQSVALTSDGGYIIAGRTASAGADPSDIYLLRTDSLGDTLWTNAYGMLHFDAGFAVQETYDGGFIIAGQLGEPDTLFENLSDVFVFKTNPLGDADWTYSWNAGLGDCAYSVRQTTDSCYIVTGVLNAAVNGGVPTSFLLKLGGNGDSLWTRTFDTPSYSKSVVQTIDGGYIICGQYGTPPATVVYLIRTNPWGDTMWTKKGNLGFQYGWGEDILQTFDGNFIITGTAFNGSEKNVYLSKIDESGNTIWTKYYGGAKDDFAYSVDKVDSGGFVITGGTYSYSSGPFTNADIWLIRTNNNGDTLWTRNYGSIESEVGLSVKSCPNGGFVLTGYSGSQPDVFLLKTDSLGNAPSITTVENFSQNKNSIIHVYPNPSRGLITIEFDGNLSSTDLLFSIYNSAGQKIQQFDRSYLGFAETHFQLNVYNLVKGLYLLKIEFEGSVQFVKFLKL
ncbi:MAG TPA: T9SS type A sorting domain-containing protein [Algoriphagus sp.]|nr:T9SS type A sorting domain-containing protein [Algoriphagus sp.]